MAATVAWQSRDTMICSTWCILFLSVIRYGGTGTVTVAIHAVGLYVTCKEVNPKTNRNDRPQPTFLSSSFPRQISLLPPTCRCTG